ncbi:peptidoglycan-binding protein [Microbacterium sp. R86528]|uniref:peptidoglycan-binding protein n=1 Tax=Microbacterium sp. R86528 TaxID=3093864 RepID=UPI0037C5BD67
MLGVPQAASANIPNSSSCSDTVRGSWGDDECWLGTTWMKYGSNVGGFQFILAAKGFAPGRVDCGFGQNTRGATTRMQQANGLTADGVVGPKSWAQARKYLSWSGVTNENGSYYNVGLDGARFQVYSNTWLVLSKPQKQYITMRAFMSAWTCGLS